jgi:glycolate oxidase iron-sulfur subunit
VQTRLSPAQLARPGVAQVDEILRRCVHCGFCNATCPTYALLGDELDGPRGRIYQVKSWLEEERAPSATDVTHIDRCLSCLACVTTCPSGVDYMHLIDFARAEVEASAARSRPERVVRALLARVLTSPRLFRGALRAGALCRPLARFAPARLRALLELVPRPAPGPAEPVATAPPPRGPASRRPVALLAGCIQDELRPQINAAARRVLERLGREVLPVSSAHCCGALAHHLGRGDRARRSAAATARTLAGLIEDQGVEYVVCTASGCGTMLKDYPQVLRGEMSVPARAIAARARDVSELVGELGGFAARVVPQAGAGVRIAVHSPCSIHHGQKLGDRVTPQLAAAGFAATPLDEPHLCCGSAGVYNVLQPVLARELRTRKVELIRRTGAELVVTGNIGCLMQLQAGLRAAGLDLPVVHAVELMDGLDAAALADVRSPNSGNGGASARA